MTKRPVCLIIMDGYGIAKPCDTNAVYLAKTPNLDRIFKEYDTKTLNVGAIYSLWADHFNFLFELQDGKYVSCGLVYKVNLKGGNRWKSGIFSY